MIGTAARKLFERMMPALMSELGSIPVSQRRGVASLLELQSRASDVLAEPPFAPLFRHAAEEYDLPAELLVAIAAVSSNFNPAHASAIDGSGIMGLPIDAIPGARVSSVTATIDELRAHKPEALENVRRCILAAAEELARLRRSQGSLMAAVLAYAGPARLPAVVGKFFLYVGATVERDRLEMLARMIRGDERDDA